MSVDGEARDEGVDVVVAQEVLVQEPFEDLRLELLAGSRAGRSQIVGDAFGRRVRLSLCSEFVGADGVQSRQGRQCPPSQVGVQLKTGQTAVEKQADAVSRLDA